MIEQIMFIQAQGIMMGAFKCCRKGASEKSGIVPVGKNKRRLRMKCSIETLSKMTALLVADFEEQMKTSTSTSVEIEQGLRETLQRIGQESLGQLLTLKDEHNQTTQEACSCSQSARRISRREGKLLSVFGWITYRRSYYGCAHCHRYWYVLDEEENLRAGSASAVMSRLLGVAGVTVSFEEAQRHIQEYLRVDVSINTIRAETQRIGDLQAEREKQWQAASQDLPNLQQREREAVVRPKRLYGSLDGAFVPLEEGWKEEKTVCWYEAGQRYGSAELRAVNLNYYTSLEEASVFGELVWATGLHHRVDQAAELVFVCDAATWIWKIIEHYFPYAVQIVDWYHACQRLHAVSETLAEQERAPWLEHIKAALWEGEVQEVIQILQETFNRHPSSELIQSAITYYQNNQTRMAYAHFRKQGYFIGSGTVESACKQIVSLRLKRPGARWTKDGASAVAKARAAWISHHWDALPLAT